FEIAWSAFEAAAAEDGDATPDRFRFLNALVQERQPEPQFVETYFLRRLTELAAKSGPTAPWPTATVRQAVAVVRRGEQATAQASAFPWIARTLEEAAQSRYESELLL